MLIRSESDEVNEFRFESNGENVLVVTSLSILMK